MFVFSFLLEILGLNAFFYITPIGLVINIILAIFASFVGLFVVWRNFLKIPYKNTRRKEVLFAIYTTLIFTAFSLVYGITNNPEILSHYGNLVAQSTAETFLECLLGFSIGFMLGGTLLRRMAPPIPPPPSASSQFSTTAPEQANAHRTRTGKMIIVFLLIGAVVGAVVGFLMGYVTWYVFGQIQLAAGVVPYAALIPPPTYYVLAWTGLGALGFAFEMPSILKSR
jgi:hypothetical protein